MSQNGQKRWFAFVIMPFSKELEDFYSKIIAPTLEACEYAVERADSTLDQRNILKDIIYNIDVADLIIADITNLNPNVMYELGIAHALGKPTVMLIQDIEQAPFDLASYNLNPYSLQFNEVDKIITRLREIAVAHCNGEISFGNPVTDFAPSKQHTVKAEAQNAMQNGASETDLASNLRLSLEEVSRYTNNITMLMNQLLSNLRLYTQQISRMIEQLPAEANITLKRILKAKNATVHVFVEKATEELSRMREAWKSVQKYADSILALISLNINNREDIDALKTLRQALDTAETTIQNAIETIKQVKESGRFDVYSDEDEKANSQLDAYFEEYINVYTIGDSYLCRILSIIDELLYGHG
jgi:hypothetical protein